MLLLLVYKVKYVQYVKGCPCACHEGIWGSGGRAVLINLNTRWRRVFDFMPYPIYPQERASHTHSIGGCVEFRAGQDTLEKR